MLLILAGVALATLTGQGNIIGNAENAVGKYNNSVADEQQFLNEIEKYFQNYLEGGNGGNPPTPPDPVEPPEVNEDGLATENTTIKPDPNSDIQITIPAGFAPAILATGTTRSLPGEDGSVKEIMSYEEWDNITTEDINKGIVIVDHAITYDNGQPSGIVPDFNEYVWVPIPDFKDFARIAWITACTWDGNGNWINGTNTTIEHPLRDEITENYWWEDRNREYDDMLESVEYYKGFYIGRYEASNNGNDIAQSKRDISPWVNVSQIVAIRACSNNETENMHLIHGIEWDSTLNWLIGNATISSSTKEKTKTMNIEDVQTNSSSWGNYRDSTGNAEENSGIKQNTGTSEYWKANNIYDLVGNVWEWTQEKYSTGSYRAERAGSCYTDGDSYPAACRSYYEEEYSNDRSCFRASFFITVDSNNNE